MREVEGGAEICYAIPQREGQFDRDNIIAGKGD